MGTKGALADPYRSSRSSVGMPWVTPRVTNLRRTAQSRPHLERPELHAHAERGHERCSCGRLSFLTLCVGMRCVKLRVTDLRRTAQSRQDTEPPKLHAHAEHGHEKCSCGHLSFLTLRVGMPCVTLRVTDLRRVACLGPDTEPPKLHTHGAWAREVLLRTPLVPHARRGNALRDAPRHRSAPRRMPKTGRRASRTACPRGAWAREVLLRTPIVPHAPAWECLA
ncbi:hypothetical protein K0038_04629 [Pseudomonas syringae]|nr:hypothetical protein [Pseudomonas syringae]